MADLTYSSELGRAELGALELGGAYLSLAALIPTTKTFRAPIVVGATAPIVVGDTAPVLAGASGRVTI